jgi:hypothetical protein
MTMTLNVFQTSILQILAAKLGPAADFAARDACTKMGTRLEALTPAQTGEFIAALKPDLGHVLSAKDVQVLCDVISKLK